jgi:PBS lyase HEAT-like repeat
VDAPNTRRKEQGGWRWPLTAVLAAACLGAVGCGTFWDDVTRRDFSFNRLVTKPDPLVVIAKSEDADDRAQALRSLREPLQSGGDQRDQAVVVSVLTTAAMSDRQVVCRMAAISALRNFKDPRAVKGLEDAYYRAGGFSPETATIVRCLALDALGATGQPEAVELLVKVLKEPPVEGATEDKQAKTDERIAAARALGRYKQYEATEALADVLRMDQDVALRDRATESLRDITGKTLPPDYQAWADFLNKPEGRDAVAKEKPQTFGIDLVSWWWK